MKTSVSHPACDGHRGSVLIIVLWVAFGLVSLALYFAQSMTMELRAADNRVASEEAAQAIAGAVRYVRYVLANAEEAGVMPGVLTYKSEQVPVGEATFWLLSARDEQTSVDLPVFGLIDEASKLNLNTATAEMLELLPNMTAEFAAAIVDWRDTNSEASANGAEDETYLRLNPPYRCKNAPFESVDELRLVYGSTLELLYGEDANLNGILDPNENDGNVSPPDDNQDGTLDCGLLSYVTVHTRESTTGPTGNTRVDVTSTNMTTLTTLLEEALGTERAGQIVAKLEATLGSTGGTGGRTNSATGSGTGGGTGGGTNSVTEGSGFQSVLEFYPSSGMTEGEFVLVEGDLMASSTNRAPEGLVNVNTASEAVLTCIPGIGVDYAATLVAARASRQNAQPTVAWVTEVLPETNLQQAGPYLTSRSYQYTADVAAVGHHGRGYQRIRFVLDTSGGTPRVAQRQDLTPLGWAMGRQIRDELRLARTTQ